MQAGDVNQTWADVIRLNIDYNYCSQTNVKDGVKSFVNCFITYNN